MAFFLQSLELLINTDVRLDVIFKCVRVRTLGSACLLSFTSHRCQRLTPSLTHKYANAFTTIQASFHLPHIACVLLESGLPPHRLLAPTSPTHRRPLGPGLLRVMTTQRCLTLGGWACILWVSEQRPRQQHHVIQTRLDPPPTPTLLVLSANREVKHYWK